MRIYLVTILLLLAGMVSAQSKTTQALAEKNPEAMSAFLYHNTLRMLNQTEDKDYDALIEEIEKMKFLLIDKIESHFTQASWKKLVDDYKAESFEEIMSSRTQGKNFNVYIKEVGGKTKGMLVLVNDSTNLYVLDIVGRVAMEKVGSLFKQINQSADLGAQISNFTQRKKKDARKEDKDDN